MIKHIVLTKLADPDRDAPVALEMLSALPAKIPCIVSLSAGRDFAGSDRSYDVGLVAEFATREDLAAYIDHPEHQPVREFMRAHRTASVAVDFEV